MAESKKNIGNGDAGSAVKAVLLISAVIMAVILIVGGIYLAGMSGKNKETQSKSEQDEHKYFSDLIYEGGDTDAIARDMEFPEMTSMEAFAFYELRGSYYHECTVVTEGADGGRIERGKRILRDGEKFNIRTYNKNALIETIKCDGENILIINETTGKSSLIPAVGQSLYELAGLPDHENVVALITEYENAEDKSTVMLSNFEYTFNRDRDENYLDLSLTYSGTGITEKYNYYLDSGIIYSCVSNVTLSGSEFSPYNMMTTYFETDISDFVREDSFKTDK